MSGIRTLIPAYNMHYPLPSELRAKLTGTGEIVFYQLSYDGLM